MNRTKDSMKSVPRIRRLRFSLRAMLGIILLVSILLAWFAFHLRNLALQDDATGFLSEHNCRTFIGKFDDLDAVDIRTV